MTYKLCLWVVFPSKKEFVEKILLNFVKKTWIHMWFLHWLIAYQSFVHLTSRCIKEHMTSLLLSTSSQVTVKQNMWWLDYLRWRTLMVQLWLLSSKSYQIRFFLLQFFLPMLKTKGITCKLMQMLSFLLDHVIFWRC